MRLTFLVLVCLILQTTLYAQDLNKVKYSIRKSDSTAQSPRKYWYSEKISESEDSNSDEVRVIVQFKGKSLSQTDKNQRTSAHSNIQNTHQQFLDDLQKFDQNNTMRRSAPSSKILFDYREVYNGYALITSKSILEEIKNLPYINYVTEDKKVQVSDINSNQVIKAPQVWSEYGITGKGITIGILDTGIDYNHPDLGGGLGPGFKVKGGYDFVNNDNNPMDDHGHGTHVAGIAAGKGSYIKGVAPDASLIAYKVLDTYGSGHDSWILAAIERSVDPDQNPATDDALDIVNMSLGREPDATEPLSEAVNNAVARGVVFVIAAGNGFAYRKINTPGIAEKAITVGATNNWDESSKFSSKGPAYKTFALKPDLTAPGENISSTYTNGTYKEFNGTSMASPHVAGAAALILEKHPDWAPEVVKAALMNTAKKSTDIIWHQGAGRINVYEAIKSEFIVTPGSFSLGLPSGDPYIKTIKAKVYNQSITAKDFTLSIEGDILNAPITVTINDPAFTLGANLSREVVISFEVNTSELPMQYLPDCFTGNLVISSDTYTVKAPITLLNPQTTSVIFEDEIPMYLWITGTEEQGKDHLSGKWIESSELDLFLPKGTYDFIFKFRGSKHFVFSEGVVTDENKTIVISKKMAKNEVTFKPLDNVGNAIPINDETRGVWALSGIDKKFMYFIFDVADTYFLSDQQKYRFDMSMSGRSSPDSEHYYLISASTDYGINQSKTYSNDLSTFKGLNIYNPSVQDIQGLVPHLRAGNPPSISSTWVDYNAPVQNPLRLLISENDPSSLVLGPYFRLNPINNMPGYSWETPVPKVSDGNLILEDKYSNHVASFLEPSYDYYLGETLLRFSAITTNLSNQIILFDERGTGTFNHYYGEHGSGTVKYELYSGGNLYKEGNFQNSPNSFAGVQNISAPPQAYKMLLNYEDYQVDSLMGKATVELDFNTSFGDKDAPILKYFSLDVAGKSVNKYPSGTPATIVAKVEDYCLDFYSGKQCNASGLSSVFMFLKKSGTEDWIPLTVLESENNEYNSLLPTSLTDGFYNFKLIAKDLSGNTLTYELDPAFMISEKIDSHPKTSVILIAPIDKSFNAGKNPVFSWSTSPFSEYIFQLSETEDFVSPLIDAKVKEETFSLLSQLEENKTYYWRVGAIFAGDPTLWSSINSFYPGTLNFTTLIYPQQGEKDTPTDINFKWSKVERVSSYGYELSLYEDFSEILLYVDQPETTLFMEHLLPDTRYFWRVSTNFNENNQDYSIPSAINHFQTAKIITAIDNPGKSEHAYSFPNPFSEITYIAFYLEKPGEVHFSILDPLGREINYINAKIAAGKNSIQWNGKNKAGENLPDGLYYGILKTPKEVVQLKMILKK